MTAQLARLLDKTAAVLRRDMLTAVRYRSGFLMLAAGTLAELAAFYYLSRAIGPGFRPHGMDYFAFLLVGTGFYTFLLMGMNSFLTSVQEAQQTGTLEVLMTTATSPSVLVFLSAISAFARNTARLLFYLAAGFLLLWKTPLTRPNFSACLVVLFLSALISISIGIFAAALQISIQKGSAVIWLLGSGAWFMTGTLFPISVLPKPLLVVAQWIPITHSLDGMRLALLQGANWEMLTREITILSLFALILLPVSLAIFAYTVRRARLDGTLAFY
jgi:ABC-2 type transport system permease protein